VLRGIASLNVIQRFFLMDVNEEMASDRFVNSGPHHFPRLEYHVAVKLSLAAAVRLLPRHNSDEICGPLVARDSKADDPRNSTTYGVEWRGGRDSNPFKDPVSPRKR